MSVEEETVHPIHSVTDTTSISDVNQCSDNQEAPLCELALRLNVRQPETHLGLSSRNAHDKHIGLQLQFPDVLRCGTFSPLSHVEAHPIAFSKSFEPRHVDG